MQISGLEKALMSVYPYVCALIYESQYIIQAIDTRSCFNIRNEQSVILCIRKPCGVLLPFLP